MESPRYPVEPVKNLYVAPFGGISRDLAAGQVGLSRNALEANTTLVAGEDQVLVTTDRHGRSIPLFTKPLFRVVALDDDHPDALRSSPHGEVVFSEDDFGGSAYAVFDTLRDGALVTLNATLAKRFPWMDAAGGGLFAKARLTRRGGEGAA